MKKLLAILVMFVAGISSSYAIFDKYTLDRDQLPAQAQEMIKEYFPKSKVGMIKIDKHLLKRTDYDVKLVNGTKIEFNNAGKWTLVDCGNRELPDGLVPRNISRSISKKFPDVKMVRVKKKSSGYEIGLSDGVEVKYDLLGIYKGVISIDN